MNIWLVSFFENTPIDDNQNTRYNSVVNEAVKRGHDVVFWSVTFRHNTKKQRFDESTEIVNESGVTLKFVKTVAYDSNASFKRIYSHYVTASRMIREFDSIPQKPDVILVAYPPISIGHKISKWANSNNIPFITDIIDPWPEAFKKQLPAVVRAFSSLLLAPMNRMAKRTFNASSSIISISNQYLEWSATYLKKAVDQRCFYPAINFDELQDSIGKTVVDSNGFNVIYAGSLGFSYDIPSILSAADAIEKKMGDKISFIIAGDGPQQKQVLDYESTHSNLNYLGRISKEELMIQYKKASIGLTQHIKGATQSVTYKLFDLLGSGLPILNSLESEMAKIIVDNQVGFHNEPGDVKSLVDNIMFCYENPDEVQKMSSNGVELTKRSGDSKVVYSEMLDWIENIGGK